MLKEKRGLIRLATKIGFTYKAKGATGREKKAVSKDISPGGIRALVDKQIKKGDWLEIGMLIPRIKKPIPAIAKVIWTADREAGKINAGIKFEEIDTGMKNKFLEHLCELIFSELERSKV